MTLTVGLMGDVMLGRGVAERLAEVSPEEVWSPELRSLCGSCNLVVCNLECCISDRGEQTGRIRGKPFFFRAPPLAVNSLRAVGVRVAGVANNHALDFEERGLVDTIELLEQAAVVPAGAGADESAARRGAVVEAAGRRLGLLAISDHPAEYAAGPATPGIAHVELARGLPRWLTAELDRLRAECDLLIAFAHWGPNMNPNTARWQERRAAELIEAGASLVAGHSAHVFHGVSFLRGSPVLFDLGDALDDYAVDRTLRNDLGVLALWRPEDAGAEIELVGLRLEYCRTGLARGSDAEWIANRLKAACSEGVSVERVAEQRFRISPV